MNTEDFCDIYDPLELPCEIADVLEARTFSLAYLRSGGIVYPAEGFESSKTAWRRRGRDLQTAWLRSSTLPDSNSFELLIATLLSQQVAIAMNRPRHDFSPDWHLNRSGSHLSLPLLEIVKFQHVRCFDVIDLADELRD